MKAINENLPLPQIITIFSEMLKKDLEVNELFSIYLSVVAYSKIEPKSELRLKSLMNKALKIMMRKRRTQVIKTPLAEQYLASFTA